MNRCRVREKQGGFTLVELLVVVAICGLIATVTGAVTIQSLTESGKSSDRLTASQQVQNAGFWVMHDGAKAQIVTLGDYPITTNLVTLTWYDWTNTAFSVTYTLETSEAAKKLVRSYSIDAGPPQIMTVADSIDGAINPVGWDGTTLTLNIVAHVGDQTAARTYETKPKPIFN